LLPFVVVAGVDGRRRWRNAATDTKSLLMVTELVVVTFPWCTIQDTMEDIFFGFGLLFMLMASFDLSLFLSFHPPTVTSLIISGNCPLSIELGRSGRVTKHSKF
jgi:hypothetical protein